MKVKKWCKDSTQTENNHHLSDFRIWTVYLWKLLDSFTVYIKDVLKETITYTRFGFSYINKSLRFSLVQGIGRSKCSIGNEIMDDEWVKTPWMDEARDQLVSKSKSRCINQRKGKKKKNTAVICGGNWLMLLSCFMLISRMTLTERHLYV